MDAFGCFLQFQYTRDYTSKPTEGQDAKDSDDSGEQLLKHARVYTLAEKLGIPALKLLAHTKIHRVNSTPRGEIEYARYVYTHTPLLMMSRSANLLQISGPPEAVYCDMV